MSNWPSRWEVQRVRALFEYWEQQAEASGSASSQGLLDEGGQVLFEGNDRHPLLERLSDDPQVRSLLAAPILVCTVDHLTPATESLPWWEADCAHAAAVDWRSGAG